MNRSFYNGIIGTKAHQTSIDVIANNISNVNSTAYKEESAEFETIFSQTLQNGYNPVSSDIGLGSSVQSINKNLSQGSLINTDNTFDLALQGEGWFGVSDSKGNISYTRDGNFTINANGDITNATGLYLMGVLGENITKATLSKEKMDKFGKIYSQGKIADQQAFSIKEIDSISLTTTLSKINLPDILYLPADPTKNVKYMANLNPTIKTKPIDIELSKDDINTTIDKDNKTATIEGTILNIDSDISPKEGDLITVTLIDNSGEEVTFHTHLNKELKWSIENKDISSLDVDNPINTVVKASTNKEVPNIEHFATEVISPNGDRDILDITWTKRVPQSETEIVWDADIKLLSYHEDYKIEQYDPNKTYDTNIYNIDTEKNIVTKIYDPENYLIDHTTNKVYKIIDSKSGVATFSGNGKLINSDLPTISNGSTPLTIDIGDPYKEITLESTNVSIEDNKITFSGSTTELKAGQYINIEYIDPSGTKKSITTKIQNDGTYSISQEYDSTDKPTYVKLYGVLNNGFSGIISSESIEKEKVSTHDGHIEGYLSGYGVNENGEIVAEFDNGRTVPVAKVGVYHFQNDEGLTKLSGSLFQESSNSGKAFFYSDKDGTLFNNTKVLSHKLEQSNVSLSKAMTELIVMQKAFNANAKSITTSDQMIQKAINMKR